ncbi:hypothetical protein C1H46_039600 [Malus baccata]|uniref:MYB-CC type transcription factor LHEQLE-containing domain-containing protein n=1 Tax=Malus baccata TaxID=106549 RepID=A0A540KKX9_MALBA|nr:hypothetical protein C1H46_039600 [Malus baccata]
MNRMNHAAMNMDVPIQVHRFHVGFGFGTSNGYIMHEFEELLRRLLGSMIREIELIMRIGEEASRSSRIVRIGELRGEATPKAIMRTMNVKGLTLFHLKSHLQKYRLGKQSGKDMTDISKDASYLLESPGTGNSSPNLPTSDLNEGYEVKEALRAQMEVQSKLHVQVEAEKHLQIRQDAERRYMAMLERACKMLADQFIGCSVTDTDSHKCHGLGNKNPKGSSIDMLGFYTLQSTDVVGVHGPDEELPISIHTQRADCSTESCLTSHESPGGLTLEGSPGGGKKRMLSLDTGNGSLVWGEAKVRTQEINIAPIDPPRGIARYGM